FRPLQLEIIERTLSGQDSIVIMPTGGGKSICYQIPALIFEKITIVVSPLISLMKDQVDSLTANGVHCAFFNSTLGDMDKRILIDDCLSNKVDLLYVSPETFVHSYDQWIRKIPISMVAVDEAHCVSSWGHDFRPEYRLIKEVRAKCKGIPFMALTATADKVTRSDIHEQLGLNSAELFLSSFNRPNLSLTVRSQIPKKKKEIELLQFLKDRPDQAGILYCLSRKECEKWSEFFNDNGFQSRFYHAGMTANERELVQDGFINDDYQIICATIAFGMGIDKSNVRWVIHNNLPKNVESYYQEIGRAGRDDLPADTVLYYNYRDVVLLNDFTQDSSNKLLSQEKIKRMLQYAEATSCRRNVLLSYFGEFTQISCGNCDVCESPPDFIDGKIIAQKALSAVLRSGQTLGMNLLINVLRGGKTAEIFDRNLHKIKTYGAGAEYGFRQWQHFVNQLINLGILEIAYDQSMHLKITEFGETVLRTDLKVNLATPIDQKEKKQKKAAVEAGPIDDSLIAVLKSYRKDLASKNGVPAYAIFNDATLKDLLAKMPNNLTDLHDVHGLGKVKVERFGEDLLKILGTASTSKNEKLSTTKRTFELYKLGLSLDEIAENRNMSTQTIINHLIQLYTKEESVDLYQFISEYEINQVKEAREKLQGTNQLKPVYEELSGEIDYPKISMAYAILDRQDH
ncbi:DNA helicase RecQ, partial [Crocinitomix catalasitica]|nr:DNA helicase RecQ [Crocinitomix catalasitica]